MTPTTDGLSIKAAKRNERRPYGERVVWLIYEKLKLASDGIRCVRAKTKTGCLQQTKCMPKEG